MPRRSKRFAFKSSSSSTSEDGVGVVVAPAKTEEAVVSGGESRRESKANTPDRDVRSPLTLHKNPDSRSSLNGMPFDMLYEIFQRLPPPDLIRLSCASKDLREFLTNRKLSISIWKKSRSLEGLPDCPGDLSELQYAALAFGQHCLICLQRYEILHYVWSARVRACSECLDTEFKAQGLRGFPKKLMELVPYVTTPSAGTKRYHVKTLSPLVAQHRKAKNKVEWVNEKYNELRAKAEHGSKCEFWFEAWLKNLKSQRKEAVISRLKKLGWEHELAILGDSPAAPQNIRIVLTASLYVNNTTDREFVEALSNLERPLVNYMTAVRNRRLTAERKSLLQARLPVLIQVIESCAKEILPANAIVPNVADIFLTPLVQDIINDTTRNDFTSIDLAPLRLQLPNLARQWQSEKEKELVTIIASAACGGSYKFDPATVLHLATTTFACADCDRVGDYRSLQYPRILIHDHTTRKKAHNAAKMTFDLEILHGVCGRTPWNQNGGVGFSMRDMEVLSNLVKVCGLDPQTATIQEMNAIDPLFECVECNSPFNGRGVMRWPMVPYHQFGFHGGSAEIEMLDEEEARIARAHLGEANARERASLIGRNKNSKDYMVCTHCNKRENSVFLARHIFQAHNIEDPTDADMVPWLDGDQSIDHIYLWPPRKDKKWLKDPNMERGLGIPPTVF